MQSSQIIFVHYETQHHSLRALNQVFHVLHTYLNQTIQTNTHCGPTVFNTTPANFRRCNSFVNFIYRLKGQILSTNCGYLNYFALVLFFIAIASRYVSLAKQNS